MSDMSKKVWEETWANDLGDIRSDCGDHHGFPFLEQGSCSSDGHDARAKLAAAAPEMARLLLELEWYDDSDWGNACIACDNLQVQGHRDDCQLVAVLRKAGVVTDR